MIDEELEYFDLSRPTMDAGGSGAEKTAGNGTSISVFEQDLKGADSPTGAAAGSNLAVAPHLIPFLGYVLVLDVKPDAGDKISDSQIRTQIEQYPSDYYDTSKEDAAGGKIPRRILLRTGWSGEGPYPCLSEASIKALHQEHGVLLLGLDTPCADPPGRDENSKLMLSCGIRCMTHLTFDSAWSQLDMIRFREPLMLYAVPICRKSPGLTPVRAVVLRRL